MNDEEMSFEVNLLPVISLLAVCISFLLLTAVWLPVGTLDIKQAVGETSENQEQPSRFEIKINGSTTYVLSLQKSGKRVARVKINDNSETAEQVAATVAKLQEKHPEINMAFVAPAKSTNYQRMVRLLEALNKLEIKNIGISPVM